MWGVSAPTLTTLSAASWTPASVADRSSRVIGHAARAWRRAVSSVPLVIWRARARETSATTGARDVSVECQPNNTCAARTQAFPARSHQPRARAGASPLRVLSPFECSNCSSFRDPPDRNSAKQIAREFRCFGHPTKPRVTDNGRATAHRTDRHRRSVPPQREKK